MHLSDYFDQYSWQTIRNLVHRYYLCWKVRKVCLRFIHAIFLFFRLYNDEEHLLIDLFSRNFSSFVTYYKFHCTYQLDTNDGHQTFFDTIVKDKRCYCNLQYMTIIIINSNCLWFQTHLKFSFCFLNNGSKLVPPFFSVPI